MKLTLDTIAQTITREEGDVRLTLPLFSSQAFEWLSREWVRMGWDQKYTYSFTWLGRPIIQFPEDLLRLQEVVYTIQPDVIIETGVAHGGSLVFHAGLCRLLGRGRVIGIDIEIRKHNRQALESHFLFPLITLVEGDSVAASTIAQVRALLTPGETTLVSLDGCHDRDHVVKELEAYAPLVSVDSYVVVQDGIMQDLADVPRGKPDWGWNNPVAAVDHFLQSHPEFVLQKPARLFNESNVVEDPTYWPSAWLRRLPTP